MVSLLRILSFRSCPHQKRHKQISSLPQRAPAKQIRALRAGLTGLNVVGVIAQRHADSKSTGCFPSQRVCLKFSMPDMPLSHLTKVMSFSMSSQSGPKISPDLSLKGLQGGNLLKISSILSFSPEGNGITPSTITAQKATHPFAF